MFYVVSFIKVYIMVSKLIRLLSKIQRKKKVGLSLNPCLNKWKNRLTKNLKQDMKTFFFLSKAKKTLFQPTYKRIKKKERKNSTKDN